MIKWIVGILIVFLIILFVILIGYLIYRTTQNNTNNSEYLKEQEYRRQLLIKQQQLQQQLQQQQLQQQQLQQQQQQQQPINNIPTSDSLKKNLEDIESEINNTIQSEILAKPNEPIQENNDSYLFMKNKAKEAQDPNCTRGDITCKPGYYPGDLMLYDQFGEDPEFIWDQICVKETATLFENPDKNQNYNNRDVEMCAGDPLNIDCQEYIPCKGDTTSIDQSNKYCGRDDDIYFKPFDCKAYEMMNKPARYIDYIKSLYGTF